MRRRAFDYDRDNASTGIGSRAAAVVDPVVQAGGGEGGATAVLRIEADLGTSPEVAGKPWQNWDAQLPVLR